MLSSLPHGLFGKQEHGTELKRCIVIREDRYGEKIWVAVESKQMRIHYPIHKLQEAPTVEAVQLVVNVGLLRHVVVLAELEDANSVVRATSPSVSSSSE